MGPARRRVTPASIAEVRRIYENTSVPVDDLVAMLGITRTTFYQRRRDWGWRLRLDRVPRAQPPREPGEAEPDTIEMTGVAASLDTPALALRIRRAVERDLGAVEKIIAQLTPSAAHTEPAERAARVLASLARTLQEVARLDVRGKQGASNEDENDRGPADPAEFVAELVRRMDAFAERTKSAVSAHASAAAS